MTVETVETVETFETAETVETAKTVLTEDLKKSHSLTDNLKARDASASKKIPVLLPLLQVVHPCIQTHHTWPSILFFIYFLKYSPPSMKNSIKTLYLNTFFKTFTTKYKNIFQYEWGIDECCTMVL